MIASIPYTCNGSWINYLKVIQLYLYFGWAWYRWTIIMNYNKLPDRLWADVSGSLISVFFPSSSWRTKSFKVKNGLVRHISGLVPETKEPTKTIFHLGLNRGSQINKTGTQGSNLCGAVSYSSWNGLHRWVVELVLCICRSVGYDHCWNLIWKSVPYHCFGSPRRGWYSPFLPQIILSWFIFLRGCFVFLRGCFVTKHPRLLKKLQYFCLKYCALWQTPNESLWSLGQQYFSVTKYSHYRSITSN